MGNTESEIIKLIEDSLIRVELNENNSNDAFHLNAQDIRYCLEHICKRNLNRVIVFRTLKKLFVSEYGKYYVRFKTLNSKTVCQILR